MAGPEYPNQQLRAVGLEAYFRGRIGFRTAAAQTQRRVEKELPNLFVPNAKPDQALDLQFYQLRSATQSEALTIAVNQVGYVSFNYPGHVAFIDRALELLPEALSDLGVDRLERVIYRYENEIAMGRDDRGVLPVDKVLQVAAGAWWPGDQFAEISCSWTQLVDAGRLGVRVAAEGDQETGEKLLISVVSMVIPAGDVGDLRQFATQAHGVARTWFEGAITDDFRRYIKGDGDGA